MHVVTMRFRLPARSAPSAERSLAITGLLLALQGNGQLIDAPWIMSIQPRAAVVQALTPEAGSLGSVRPSRHVRAALRDLKRLGIVKSTMRMLGPAPD